MITVGMNYHVIPGKRQKEFEDKFAAVLAATCVRPKATALRRSGRTSATTPLT